MQAKRASIMDAAGEVFCRESFAGANIDMIAAEAGVSRQTIYNHHGDKENLFVAVVRDVTERFNAGYSPPCHLPRPAEGSGGRSRSPSPCA